MLTYGGILSERPVMRPEPGLACPARERDRVFTTGGSDRKVMAGLWARLFALFLDLTALSFK